MRTAVSVLVVLGYIGLLGFVLWFFATRRRLPLRDKISGLLQLLAVYTFVMGLLSASGVFTIFGSLQRELTSSDPLVFLRANLMMFTGLFSAMAVAMDPNTLSGRAWIALPLSVALTILLFVYALIHFLVIVPIAYFAYVITSVPVDAILNAPSDVQISIGSESVRIKELVLKNETAIRNFSVGIPSFVLSLLLKMWPLVRGERSPR
jgi:hypothetical protein